MKTYKPLGVFCMVFTIVLSTPAPAGTPEELPAQLLQVSTYHGDEVTAKSGETWWGLFPGADGLELRPTVITVTIVKDEILDEAGQMTGKTVTVDDPQHPEYLVKGIPNLKAGSLRKASFESRFLFPGESLFTQLLPKDGKPGKDEKILTLSALGEAIETEIGIGVRNYSLVLYQQDYSKPNSEKQLIASFEYAGEEVTPMILWAGDLDGDGKLDFIMDLAYHYNVMKTTVFLSTLATDGQFVGKAAELVTTGC